MLARESKLPTKPGSRPQGNMVTTTATSRVHARDTAARHEQREDGASTSLTGLASLARKLRHPLGRIRVRALENLLFKLREGLVDIASEPVQAVDDLASALVVCLDESELETSALQVLQLLLADDALTRVCAPPLRKHGAAAALQRGTVQQTRADLPATHESLLNRLLATTTASQEAPVTFPNSSDSMERASHSVKVSASVSSRDSRTVQAAHATVAVRQVRANAKAHDQQSDPLTHSGWKFPHVALAAMDEQFLFEFEVKWRLRTTVPEIVDMCDTLRRELLRDFPPEIFLQRPAVLLRVLELVQQPIVPAATTPELSFGVNYFDEPASPSFVWKPSVQATALHVSSLKAIESWLSAMRHAMEISLNPMYHTFQSSSAASSAFTAIGSTSFDHRRLFYPRVVRSDEDGEPRDEGLSLSGAAYLLTATLIRLLPSTSSFPRLHLLNLIHAATDLLPERSVTSRGDVGGLHALDKQRMETLFVALADLVAGPQAAETETLVGDRIVEWVVRVLQLFKPSAYRVEGSSRINSEGNAVVVEIPSRLWTWMLHALATGDPKNANGIVNILAQIDSSASQALGELRESQRDARDLDAALRSVDTTNEAAADVTAPAPLPLVLRILERVPTLPEPKRTAASRVVLHAICCQLETVNVTERDESAQLMNRILLQTLQLITQGHPRHCQELMLGLLDRLVDWTLDEGTDSSSRERLQALIRVVVISGEFMQTLLCWLAGSAVSGADAASDSLWRLAEITLRGLEHSSSGESTGELQREALSTSVALLQHFAYADSNFLSGSSECHQRLQRTFVHLVHQLEASLPVHEQLLLVSRCLVHRSAYIRKAAAAGLFEQLTQHAASSVEHISRDSLVVVNPFGQYIGAGGTSESQRRVLENEIPSLLQPRLTSENERNTQSGRSLLHRITRLRKLVLSTSVCEDEELTSSTAAPTLHQMLIDIVQAEVVDFTVLQEAGEVDELFDMLIRVLARSARDQISWVHAARGSLVAIVRVLLMRSAMLRGKVRQDTAALSLLLSFVYDDDARVRAESYFVVLALACSLEVAFPSHSMISSQTLELPTEFTNSFGLFSARWSLCGISLRPLVDSMQKHGSASLKDEYLAPPESNSVSDRAAPLSPSSSLHPIQALWSALSAAKSFRTFLDALYYLIQACYAQQDVCVSVSKHWEEASLQKYLDTTPTSAKDHVILAAVLALVNAVFQYMTKDQQMSIVLLLRRAVIPLEFATDGRHGVRTTALSTQLARLLLHISKSEVSDMFVSLVVNAGLAKRLGNCIVSSGIAAASAPLQRALWMDVALGVLEKVHAQRDVEESPVQQQLVQAILSPLRAIAGRHRVPGSFHERDVYVRAVACLTPIDTAGQDEDAVHWRSRLLFDSSSTIRSLGFRLAGWKLTRENDADDNRRVLRLVVDTMRDESECDAVRSAAAQVLFQFLERADASALSEYAASIDAEKFVVQMMRDLVASGTRASERCYVRLSLARVQLLRLFVCHHEKFAHTPLETLLDPLLVCENDDFKSIRAIVELLSLQRVFESYLRHCVTFLRMHSARDAVWFQSILPVSLKTIAETARILQALLQPPLANADQIISGTPVLLQVIETLSDVAKSLNDSTELNGAVSTTLQNHYEALDECGKLVALLLVTSTKHGSSSLPVDTAKSLIEVVSTLLHDSHPKRFRLSFTRVVAAIFSRPPGSLLTEATASATVVPLAVHLWTMYRELCEQQPADAATRSFRITASFLPQLRRSAFALQVVVSRSQDACSNLCADRHGAVQHVVRTIKSAFMAIRMSGGFGAKTAKNAANEVFVVEICTSIQIHCQVLSGFLAKSTHAQDVARTANLLGVFAANWNVMRVAHRRGSSVLVSALRVLQNYVHCSQINKRTLATTTAAMASARNPASDSERTLLDLIGELALGPASSSSVVPFDENWSSTAGAILKSAFLHVDCLHGALKTGLVAKLFASVVERCKRLHQTVKPQTTQEQQTLVELLGVLASVASSDDGRQVILQLRELKDLLNDVLRFAVGSEVLVAGALFVRNMAFSKFSKSHFAVWEPVVDQILSLLSRAGSVPTTNFSSNVVTVSCDHLSTALLCVVVDNQRAQAVLQSSVQAQTLLQECSHVWRRRMEANDADKATSSVWSNLEKVQSLLVVNETTRP